MKEHPILFNGAMVRAVLEGRKTETRRPVKLQPPRPVQSAALIHGFIVWSDFQGVASEGGKPCPFGAPGDRLWVRETWANPETVTYYRATDEGLLPAGERWRPSIHMPRWASRITLEVEEVRVERLWEIDKAGSKREGFSEDGMVGSPLFDFSTAWEEIYGNWDSNPWVWVVRFKRVA